MRTMRELSEILAEIVKGPSVQFSAIVTRDGFIIESSSSAAEGDNLGVSRVAQLLFAAESIGEELEQGGVEEIVVKYGKGLVMVDCIDADTLLMTAVENGSSMAWVKYTIEKNLPEIHERI
jgi:predicted regulator of Ras-like GTPase activity (Roadblock/LC7/MglB family)